MPRAGGGEGLQQIGQPFALFATDARSAALVLERRRVRFGMTSVTTHQPSMEALGEVLAAHRALLATSPPEHS